LQPFEVVDYHTTSTKSSGSSATVTLKVGGEVHSAAAPGNGPVNALDLALRQCLSKVYPSIASVRLTDYKVRVLDFKKGTRREFAFWWNGRITRRAGRRWASPKTSSKRAGSPLSTPCVWKSCA
jgi:hypothetical protein